MPPAWHLPPRPLHGVGLTWLKRGPAYWSRRIGLAFAWLLISAITGVMAVGITLGVASSGTLALTIFLCVYAVLGGGTVYVAVHGIRTMDRSGIAGATGRRKRSGGRMGTAAALGSGIAQVLVIFAAPVAVGFSLPYLVRSFGRYAIGERFERKRIGLDA